MRISGLATGIDTESMVKELMNVERLPMDKMEQQKITMEWQRDKYREINTLRQQVDDLALSMRLSSTYHAKTMHSSNENAVTATAGASTNAGSYKIEVKELATSAINVGAVIEIDPDADLFEVKSYQDTKKFTLTTYNEKGEAVEYPYEINPGDTLKDVIKRINDDDNSIRMFYDSNTKQVIMETTRTGQYNPNANGNEIEFDDSAGSIFTDLFGLHLENEHGGTNARFTYNDAYEVTAKENRYSLNGMSIEFKNINEGNPTTLSVTNHVDGVMDKVKAFVEKYNELIELMNGTQREQTYRDFPPLTEEQRNELEEREIELWEEKAKSGILRGDSIITSALSNLRANWYRPVETGGEYTSITQIGITTTKDYFDGGKIEINEDKLREALNNDAESVYQIFAGNEDTKGIVYHLEDSLDRLRDQINERAGRSSDTLANYTLGRRMNDIDKRMDAFEKRLQQIESRYWRQFTAMEKAISQMNSQSMMLMNNFFSY